MSAEPTAALRDASYYRKPGWSGKYHIVAGRDDERDRFIAACSPYRRTTEGVDGVIWPRMALLPDTSRAAVEVPDYMRCGRPGCRQRWPEPAASVSRGTVTE